MRQPDESMRFEEAVADALESIEGRDKLVIRAQPRIGEARPDFVIDAPDGGTYVIEVKAGLGASRLGSMAQLAAYRDVVSRDRGHAVTPILVAVGPRATELEEAAQDFGIEVIAGQDIREVLDSVTVRFSSLAAGHGRTADQSGLDLG